MSDYIDIVISQIGQTITGLTPSSKFPKDFGSDYMFVTPSDDLNGKIISKTKRYLSKIGFEKLKAKALPPHSVLVTCIGSAMGKVVMNDSTCVTNQQINSIKINTANYSSEYIYYCLNNNYKLIRNAASGSTALPLLNKTDFDNLKFKIHKDLFIQSKIAKVLSDLDAKIEVNNKINQELEAMAKLLYDYWFVQFDFPYSPPSEGCPQDGVDIGKPYKSSGGKMVYNEYLKREIPEGWINVSLLHLCDKIGDGIHGTPNYIDKSEYSFINGNNLKDGFIRTDIETKKVSKEEYQKYFIELSENTILMGINGTIGNLAVYKGEKVMLGKSSAYINCKDKHRAYCYQFLKQDHMLKLFWNIATGSTIKNLSLDSIKRLKILLPNNKLIEKFYSKTKSLDEKRMNIFKENKQLTELRDWLLPMLMNGQVTVGEAAAQLGMVAEDGEEYKS